MPQLQAMSQWAKDNAVPASVPDENDANAIKYSRHIDLDH
jgi:hypothetical protein